MLRLSTLTHNFRVLWTQLRYPIPLAERQTIRTLRVAEQMPFHVTERKTYA